MLTAGGQVDLGQFKNRFPQVKAGELLFRKTPRRLGEPGRSLGGELVEERGERGVVGLRQRPLPLLRVLARRGELDEQRPARAVAVVAEGARLASRQLWG